MFVRLNLEDDLFHLFQFFAGYIEFIHFYKYEGIESQKSGLSLYIWMRTLTCVNLLEYVEGRSVKFSSTVVVEPKHKYGQILTPLLQAALGGSCLANRYLKFHFFTKMI